MKGSKVIMIVSNKCKPFVTWNKQCLMKHFQTSDCLIVKHEFRLLRLNLARLCQASGLWFCATFATKADFLTSETSGDEKTGADKPAVR